jgi:hypothetical protein
MNNGMLIYHTINIQDCAQYTQQKLTFMVAGTCLRYGCGLKQNTAWYMTGKDFSVILKLHRYFCLQKSCWKIYGLQVRASSYIQMNQPTRCSNFSGLLLFV